MVPASAYILLDSQVLTSGSKNLDKWVEFMVFPESIRIAIIDQ